MSNLTIIFCSSGLIAANPLPIQHCSELKFVEPTGARTDNNKSSFSDIFFGAEHQTLVFGYKSPKSDLP